MGVTCSTKCVGFVAMTFPVSQILRNPSILQPHASADIVDGSAEYGGVLCVPKKGPMLSYVASPAYLVPAHYCITHPI